MSYCDAAPGHPIHGPYHEREHGFPVASDAPLFERFVLEINQAGLSWLTVLQKRDAFRRAFAGYDIDRVARFTDARRAKLMQDAGIIRNRLKIAAVIENAKRIRALRHEHGSFAAWLDAHHPLTKPEWVKLFKRTFVFTGGEITGELLMSVGYLPGAHVESCPVYAQVLRARPQWANV